MNLEKTQKTIELLNNCAAACNQCTVACLNEAEVKMLTTCIQIELDCAEICRITASFLARGSAHAKHLLKECAEICNACAEECKKHSHMEHCKVCAETCRVCAKECKNAAA